MKSAIVPQMACLTAKVPFEGSERERFDSFLQLRGAKTGPFLRQLILTVMDPATGPIIEAAMRGRPAPDLEAGQARELSAALKAGA